MKKTSVAISTIFALVMTPLAFAQTPLLDDLPEIELPEFVPQPEQDEDEAGADESDKKPDRPDYAHLPPEAEKQARLNDLFAKLKLETEADKGNLIAEEIWAIWLDSGSASVDLLLRRGTAAGKKGDQKLARRLYDHVTTIKPEYAEGWSRSGRLAYEEEEDYNRAVVELTEALIREPRHFYALWSMGNIMESLGRADEALEIYSQAYELYPSMPQIKERKEALEAALQGAVL